MGHVRYSVFLQCYVPVGHGKGLAVLLGAEVLSGGRGQVSLAHPAISCEVYIYIHGEDNGLARKLLPEFSY